MPDNNNFIFKDLESQEFLIPERLRPWWKNYLTNHKARYEFTIQNFISDSQSVILEIGSIPCHLLYMLKQLGHQVKAVDLAPERLSEFIEKNGLDVKKVDIEQEQLPFQNDSFDLILFAEVLEHLRINPLFCLKEIYRVLKPNGRIILSTPNISILNKINFIRGLGYQGNPVEEFSKLEKIGHMGHIRLYEKNEIELMLTHNGFEQFQSCYFGGYPKGLLTRILKPVYGQKLKSKIFISASK